VALLEESVQERTEAVAAGEARAAAALQAHRQEVAQLEASLESKVSGFFSKMLASDEFFVGVC
jgi:predicted  nucleic acid-binding Zn-ribbon protein